MQFLTLFGAQFAYLVHLNYIIETRQTQFLRANILKNRKK